MDNATETVFLHPAWVHIKAGQIEIIPPDKTKTTTAQNGLGYKLLIDGKEMDRVKSMHFIFAPDKLLTAIVEILA